MFLAKQGNLWLSIPSLVHRLREDSLLRNSVFIMASTVVTAGIGYLFWILVAHIYSTYNIGLASAFISVMTITSIFSNLGIGSALVQTLPRREAGDAWSLTLNACLVVGTVASLLGSIIVALILPILSPQFALTRQNVAYILIFIIGVLLSTVVTLLDQAFVAERATGNMALRNAAFALLKLLLVVPLMQLGALGIFSSWVLALVATVMLTLLVLLPRLKRGYRFAIRGIIQQIRSMLSLFAGHHFINIGGILPMYLLPVFVSVRLSVTDNAYFYTTWMMGSLFFMVSPSVAMALFSEGSHAVSDIMRKARTSILIISMLLCPIMLVFLLGGRTIMSLFGASYPQHGLSLLVLLTISAVPDAITNVYVSLLRVQGRLRQAALLNLGMAAITLTLAWILLPTLGLAGAGWAWLIAQSAGSLFVGADFLIARSNWFASPATVAEGTANALYENRVAAFSVAQRYTDVEAISLIDTAIVPIVRLLSSNQMKRNELISSIDTEVLPARRSASHRMSLREDVVSPGDKAVLPVLRLPFTAHKNGFRKPIPVVPLREDEATKV